MTAFSAPIWIPRQPRRSRFLDRMKRWYHGMAHLGRGAGGHLLRGTGGHLARCGEVGDPCACLSNTAHPTQCSVTLTDVTESFNCQCDRTRATTGVCYGYQRDCVKVTTSSLPSSFTLPEASTYPGESTPSTGCMYADEIGAQTYRIWRGLNTEAPPNGPGYDECEDPANEEELWSIFYTDYTAEPIYAKVECEYLYNHDTSAWGNYWTVRVWANGQYRAAWPRDFGPIFFGVYTGTVASGVGYTVDNLFTCVDLYDDTNCPATAPYNSPSEVDSWGNWAFQYATADKNACGGTATFTLS